MSSSFSDSSPLGPLTLFRRSAMASDFEIFLNARLAETEGEAALNALDEIDRIEDILSIFRPTSLLSRVNLLAAETNVPLPPEVFDWFRLGREIWEKTDGAYDLTCSPLWKVWGFAKREGKLPSDADLQAALELVGTERLILDEERSTIAFDRPGIEVNFGGIGKGIALDRAAAVLESNRIWDFMIHGGKSSVVARGGRSGDFCRDGDEKFPAWTIGVMNPLRPGVRLAEIHLVDEAVGTSGSMQQFFRHKGKKLSHIIDPRSGLPATGVLSATVVAPTAAEADALSTAFFVLGPQKSEEFCRKNPEISAIFILETVRAPHYEIVPVNMRRWNLVDNEPERSPQAENDDD